MKKHYLPLRYLQKNYEKLFVQFYCLSVIYGMYIYSNGYRYFLELTQKADWTFTIDVFFILSSICLFIAASGLNKKIFITLGFLSFAVRELIVSTDLKPYSTNISFIVFIILIIDKKPTRMTHAALSIVYSIAAITKIVWHPGWINGQTLRYYFLEAQLLQPSILLESILNNPEIFMLLAPLVLAWELMFPLSVFYRIATIFYFSTGIIFHLLIWNFIGPNFFHFFIPTYLSMLPKIFNFNET